jgi:hypothetical protein
MKISNYLPLILYTTLTSSAGLLGDGKSLAESTHSHPCPINCNSSRLGSKGELLLAQGKELSSPNQGTGAELDNKISIVPDPTDKSLLKVKGSITNRGEQSHYVYYIVAKLVSGDTPVKQTIIPVNSTIERGETLPFTHEISTESLGPLSIKNIKPIIIKSEYR